MLAHVEAFVERLPDVPIDPSRIGVDPDAIIVTANAAVAIIMAPPDEEIASDLVLGHDQMWRAIAVAPSDMLSAQSYHTGSTHPICLGEIFVLAAMRLAHNLLQTLPAEQAMTKLITTLPWVDATRPILSLTMRELLGVLQTTRTAFVEHTYSDALADLVDLLEYACARMLFETGLEGTFNLNETYCRPLHGSIGEKLATATFLRVAWATMTGFRRRLLESRCLLGENDDTPMRNEAASARLRTWLVRRAEQTAYADASPSLRRIVPLFMRPGDRELFRLEHPTVTTSDAGIVNASIGDVRMADFNRRMYRSPSTCIREQTGANENIDFGLCVHDFLDMITRASPGCEWARFFGRFDADMNVTEVQRLSIEYPFVVYVFNGWQLAYRGCVYWYNSIVDAIVRWLHILAVDGPECPAVPFAAASRASVYAELLRFVVHGQEPIVASEAMRGAPAFLV